MQELCEDLATKQNPFAHKQRHACVLTYNNAVISSGINVNLKNDFTRVYNDLKGLHAESVAIMRAIGRHHNILHKCELWVCRRGKASCFSRPCPMCSKISIIRSTMGAGQRRYFNVFSMQVDLSRSELDLIVIALKVFIDDNELYAENIAKELSNKDLENLSNLNMLTDQLIARLDASLLYDKSIPMKHKK